MGEYKMEISISPSNSIYDYYITLICTFNNIPISKSNKTKPCLKCNNLNLSGNQTVLMYLLRK